jgi:hypothetical protein
MGCKRDPAAPAHPLKSSGLTNALLFYHAVAFAPHALRFRLSFSYRFSQTPKPLRFPEGEQKY